MGVSKGEAVLELLLKHGKVRYLKEYRFHPTRKWRFDFAVLPLTYQIAIEVEGGVFSGGRHTRGQGYQGDLEKYNEAALLGWTVLRYSTQQVNEKVLYDIRQLIGRKDAELQGPDVL